MATLFGKVSFARGSVDLSQVLVPDMAALLVGSYVRCNEHISPLLTSKRSCIHAEACEVCDRLVAEVALGAKEVKRLGLKRGDDWKRYANVKPDAWSEVRLVIPTGKAGSAGWNVWLCKTCVLNASKARAAIVTSTMGLDFTPYFRDEDDSSKVDILDVLAAWFADHNAYAVLSRKYAGIETRFGIAPAMKDSRFETSLHSRTDAYVAKAAEVAELAKVKPAKVAKVAKVAKAKPDA